MFAYGTATWVDEITSRLMAKFVSSGVLTKADVLDYIGPIDDLLESPPAKKFVVIAPTSLPVIPEHVAGAGFGHTNFDATWRVDFALQLMERDHRTSKLMAVNDSKSMTAFVRSGAAIMQGFSPTQAADEDAGITLQPNRLLRMDFGNRRPASGWAFCHTEWEILFRSDFS